MMTYSPINTYPYTPLGVVTKKNHMGRLVDKLMRIVLIKNFLGDDGDDQIDYSNVDSDDEDKKCWMLCLPCRVPPLRCHSMLQLHGYPLTTFLPTFTEKKINNY